MNTELQVLRKKHYLKIGNKKVQNKLELFFDNFEEKLKERLIDEMDILLLEKSKAEILKEKYEIIERICYYPTLKMLIVKCQNNLDVLKILDEEDIKYYASVYLDNIFTNALKSFDRNQEDFDKYEKQDVYNLLYDYFLRSFEAHKGYEKQVYEALNKMEERKGCFKEVETTLPFSEYNKIHTKVLNEFKAIYKEQINKKEPSLKWRKEGLGWAFAIWFRKFAKSLKPPRK